MTQLPAPTGEGLFSAGCTPTAYQVDSQISYDEWSSKVNLSIAMSDSIAWWIGDLINYGEVHWPEIYTQAIPDNYQPATLIDYARVSRRIPPEDRQESVCWSVHREVAALPPGDRDELLDQALEDGLGVRAMRDLARERRAEFLPPAEPKTRDIISGDVASNVAWSGTVVVEGPIITSSSATITIEPGTRVHFI